MSKIDDMPAGRELDALVAEKVMDDPVDRQIVDQHGFEIILRRSRLVLPRYSTDISAAWKIVEHLRSRNMFVELSEMGINKDWSCSFDGEDGKTVHAEGDTAPMAICMAALLAVRT